MSIHYNQLVDGQWVDVTDGHYFACCDCGLVHLCEYKVVEGRIIERIFRQNRDTANQRRTNETKASLKALAIKQRSKR